VRVHWTIDNFDNTSYFLRIGLAMVKNINSGVLAVYLGTVVPKNPNMISISFIKLDLHLWRFDPTPNSMQNC